MLKVSDIVKDIVFSSEPELAVLSRHTLNLSAYAKQIQSEVEKRTHKPVQLGTIVVALSRLSAELADADPLLPKIELDGITVKSNLAEITFNKTSTTKLQAQKLYAQKAFVQADFLMITHGASEISIFTSMPLVQFVLKNFKPDKPKLLLDNLAALTVQFSEKYIEIPNLCFALMQVVAVRKINIVELVSTFTEFTFLVRQTDLNDIFLLMNSLMRKAR